MDLNLNTSKNQKKPFKIHTKPTQSIDLTTGGGVFNLSSGGAQNKVTGKVFRRKQNVTKNTTTEVQSNTQKQTETQNKPTKDIPFQKSKPFKMQHTEKQTNQQNKSKFINQAQKNDSFGVNIKRKHKKDKAKALLDKEEGKEAQLPTKTAPKSFSLFNERHKDVYVASCSGKSVSEKVFTESGGKFSDLPIHKYVVSNLEKIQFTTLTTVQEKAIPVVLSGKDVLIRSQTGSGKTLAYAVPIIDALQGIAPRIQRKDGVQAIVVVPTRELALQTHDLFSKINTFQWIVTGHLCGGENRKSEKDRLRKGVHVLIGTPGRLLDHVLHTSALKVDNVRCLVLDEADRLLDMGFRRDIISLVEHLTKVKNLDQNSEYDPMQMLKSQNSKIKFADQHEEDEDDNEGSEEADNKEEFPLTNINNKNRQTILLSATLNQGVTELADFAMKNHVFVDALNDNINNNNLNSLVIPDSVKQGFILTYVKHRLFTLSALIVAKCKKNSKLFVFMASTQMVEYHYELFTKYLVKMPVNRGKLKTGNVVLFDTKGDDDSDAEEEEEEIVLNTQFFKLHGNMDQKMRKEVFRSFRDAKTGVLLCSDVAARGLDVPAADCIIQYTGPQTDEDYLHRVGRTGRAGQSGSAIIFFTHEEQEYISHLNEHRVFLKQLDPEEYLRQLCDIMQEPDHERAAEALQRRFESAVAKDKKLHLSACLAYSTWSRFYNSYPTKMRSIFNFKNINLGHYATSFALRDTPSQISRTVKGQVSNTETPRLNKKLSNHTEEQSQRAPNQKKKQKRSISLITSEYSSGLEPAKKKKKKSE